MLTKKIKNNKNNKNNILYKNIYDLDKNGVLELVLSDFEYKKNKLYIKNDYFKEKKGFILFYAPWCKHCIHFSDTYSTLALSNLNIFFFGAVNCENIEDKNDILCNYANISKYPILKYINNDGTLTDYKFDYNYDNLIFFINTNI
jgi:thiol-disulfide isomerase/thioredoxin